jgi:hypothetical protein
MALAPEKNDGAVDQALVTRFAAAVFEALLLVLDSHRTLPSGPSENGTGKVTEVLASESA